MQFDYTIVSVIRWASQASVKVSLAVISGSSLTVMLVCIVLIDQHSHRLCLDHEWHGLEDDADCFGESLAGWGWFSGAAGVGICGQNAGHIKSAILSCVVHNDTVDNGHGCIEHGHQDVDQSEALFLFLLV